jgi:hypothetical protein
MRRGERGSEQEAGVERGAAQNGSGQDMVGLLSVAEGGDNDLKTTLLIFLRVFWKCTIVHCTCSPGAEDFMVCQQV